MNGDNLDFLYNLGKHPASWDFLQWLVNAQIVNGGGPLRIALKPGPRDGFRIDDHAQPLDQRRAILENVIRPTIAMAGGVEVDGVPGHRYRAIEYLACFTVRHFKGGGPLSYLRVPPHEGVAEYLGGRRPVVVTLRETDYYPTRNSNIPAWTEWARGSGEDVVFVRDTAKADESLPGFETCPRASRDLHYRAALMRAASCNLMVSCGPWVLALYSPTPWLSFGQLHPEIPKWLPGAAWWWTRFMGVGEGEQFPWAHECQRLIWKDDSLRNIQKAWEQYGNSS